MGKMKATTKGKVAKVIDMDTAQPSPNNDRAQSMKKKHGITTTKTTNKKLIVSEDQPCNNKEREVLQKKLHPTMLAFLNFPAGRKTKTARKLESMKSPISIEATAPKVPCKVSKR